ncbi:MAG: HTTM domain-containing protein [Planctomycetota bacterium]
MNNISHSPYQIAAWFQSWNRSWNQFWFSNRDSLTLAIIRILTGTIVIYSHLIWCTGGLIFLSGDGLIPSEYRNQLFGTAFAWSLFDWVDPVQFWWVHWVGIAIVIMFTIGLWTRWTAILTAILVISYANRGMGALFGLDQIASFLCLYLAISNSGDSCSIDCYKQNGNWIRGSHRGTVWNNIATRFIQIHMCIVYLFAGVGKLQGETWITGEAIWGAMASYEYQTIDMTWLSGAMWLVAVLTLGTLVWEVGYPALIWSPLTRPVMLALAIPIHLGIGLTMGMMTFGLIMLVGNLAFVEPEWFRSWWNSKQSDSMVQSTGLTKSNSNSCD